MPFPDISSISFTGILVKAAPYLFWLTVVLCVVAGGILDYHWRTYGIGLIKLLEFRVSFVVGVIVLLGVMYLALISL